MLEGRKRGHFFDVGTAGEFACASWRQCRGRASSTRSRPTSTPAARTPDERHAERDERVSGPGLSFDDVLLKSHGPLLEIKQEQLAPFGRGICRRGRASTEKGSIRLLDGYGADPRVSQKLTCEMTLRDGTTLRAECLPRPDPTTRRQGYRSSGDPPRGNGPRSRIAPGRGRTPPHPPRIDAPGDRPFPGDA